MSNDSLPHMDHCTLQSKNCNSDLNSGYKGHSFPDTRNSRLHTGCSRHRVPVAMQTNGMYYSKEIQHYISCHRSEVSSHLGSRVYKVLSKDHRIHCSGDYIPCHKSGHGSHQDNRLYMCRYWCHMCRCSAHYTGSILRPE